MDATAKAAAGRLSRSSEQLTDLLGRWTPSRFAGAASPSVVSLCIGATHATAGPVGATVGRPPQLTVAEALLGLVQALADRGAVGHGWPRRSVPRLDDDRGLADQLSVMTADLLDVEPVTPESLISVADTLDAVRKAL